MEQVREQIESHTGLRLRLGGRLAGGEQDGAYAVVAIDDRPLVLKLQPDPAKARRLLRAAPVVAAAVDHGWPAAAWLHWGLLDDGTAFVLQEHVDGHPVRTLDLSVLRSILRANARQAGLGTPEADDDSAQLRAVLSDGHPWREAVRTRSPYGAALVARAAELTGRIGPVRLPTDDLVHGDYSTANMIIGDDGEVRFIDCETVARGTRVRDLADLYRQCAVYPGTEPAVTAELRATATAVAGPAVFVLCLVAVSLNNLAWWVEHKSVVEFDTACRRLLSLFDDQDDPDGPVEPS